jgi:3-(3-hydroxy-phenyl)propionate hydroxylase
MPLLDTATETPPVGRSDLAPRPPLRRTLAGRLCPNAPIGAGRRFDDVAAGRFAVVTTADPSEAQRAHIDQQGGVLVVTRPGSELSQWLRRGRATAAIVRPDGTVLRAGHDLALLCAAVPAFTLDHRAGSIPAPV